MFVTYHGSLPEYRGMIFFMTIDHASRSGRLRLESGPIVLRSVGPDSVQAVNEESFR